MCGRENAMQTQVYLTLVVLVDRLFAGCDQRVTDWPISLPTGDNGAMDNLLSLLER